MNRAMFSAVAGLKAHQTKMDVIGNNVSNVNTYGYKSQRAVFSDIFYQTIKGASSGTANRGGTNPSSVGYGSSLAAVQTQMTQSSMQNTGYGLDVAITGDGFLQVMDADGNIFYTKAGLIDYDANGYLVDINGNFVLGATSKDAAPGTQKIKLDNIGSVDPRRSTVSETINNHAFTFTAGNPTKYGDVSISLSNRLDLPAGQKAVASISGTGAISVQLNASESFSGMAELNGCINQAITEANGGTQHAGGQFTLTCDPAITTWPLTGQEISGTNFATVTGTIVGMEGGAFGGGMVFTKASTDFNFGSNEAPVTINGGSATDFSATYHAPAGGTAYYSLEMKINGISYTADITENTNASSVLLKSASNGYIQVTNPGFTGINNYAATELGHAPTEGEKVAAFATNPTSLKITPSVPSKELGLSSITFSLTGGTEGGVITLDQLSSIAIGSDGTVSVTHAEKGTVVAGKISLASFANPAGLQLDGTNYYSATSNSGTPKLSDPGSNGTGALKSSALEMSNVDLSSEMAEMIVTQRGFQANSRIITVSDTMLEELINLKR